MIELTEQQRRDLNGAEDGKIWLSDPDTKQEYVLMHREVYEQLVRFWEKGRPSERFGPLSGSLTE